MTEMSNRILIVDDEAEIADLIEVYLKNENYTVFICHTAEDALQCINTTPIDLAVLDLMLPDMSGLTLGQKIRERHRYPIIMLTAKNQETDKITGLTMGADDYLTKPFRPLELVARIKAQLRRYKQYNPAFSKRAMKPFEDIDERLEALLRGEEAQAPLPQGLAIMEQKLGDLKEAMEKRLLDAQLAEQRKNDLVMYLAHDIRTPLTSVIGYLNLLDEAQNMPQQQRQKYTRIALDKAYRLEKMIDEFFEITKYSLQQIQLNPEPIDLYYMLVQLTDELLPALEKNANRTAIQMPSENLTLCGDREALARAFNNLLKNAAAYSQSHTEIVISAQERDGWVEIRFQNQGKTIPPDKLERIFEKFYRADDSRNSDSGGTGLGLAIAKEIIVRHGGTIRAESQDNRVAFVVTLPQGAA